MNFNAANYAEVIRETLEGKDLLKDFKKVDDGYLFYLPGDVKNIPHFTWCFKIKESGSAKFWCLIRHDVSKEERTAVLKTLNDLNNEYRLLRFTLDRDNDIVADYDFFPCGGESVAIAHTLTLLMLLSQIVDQGFLRIMKTLCNLSEAEDEENGE